MRKKIYILLSSVFFFIMSDIYSQEDRWIYVGCIDDVSVYYDSKMVKSGENSTMVLLKYINISDNINQYIIYKVEFYPNKDYYKLISVTVYPKEGSPYVYTYNETKEIITDSFEETAYKFFY